MGKSKSYSGRSRIRWTRRIPKRRRISMSKYVGKLRVFSRTNKYKKQRAVRFNTAVKNVV